MTAGAISPLTSKSGDRASTFLSSGFCTGTPLPAIEPSSVIPKPLAGPIYFCRGLVEPISRDFMAIHPKRA